MIHEGKHYRKIYTSTGCEGCAFDGRQPCPIHPSHCLGGVFVEIEEADLKEEANHAE